MKEQGRTFQREPCREIIIFFAVSDASPYLTQSTLAVLPAVVPASLAGALSRVQHANAPEIAR
jgi:hypothetical protein